jgi:hypothetical protein
VRVLCVSLAAAAFLLEGAPQAMAVQPLSITKLSVAFANTSTANVIWRLNRPAKTWMEVLSGSEPVVWFPARRLADGSYTASLTALQANTTYRFRVVARTARAYAALKGAATTPRISRPTRAAADGGIVRLNNHPFFPLMAWNQCSTTFGQGLALGMNLFLGSCNWESQQTSLAAIAGRGYLVLPVSDRGVDAPELIGFNYLDEADAFGVLAASQPDLPSPVDSGKLRFWTLSYHFYSVADPVSSSFGKDIYPSYFAKADVVGFDLYPLVKLCGNNWIGVPAVFDALTELIASSAGKPTYEWIETGPMEGECGSDPVTPATVRAETWLAIAGGAVGIGYFTHTWQIGHDLPGDAWSRFDIRPDIASTILDVNREIQQLAPALLGPRVAAAIVAKGSPLRIGARRFNGALYEIAVNPTPRTIKQLFLIPSAINRRLSVLGEGRSLVARGGRITDTFGPWAVHLYVLPPAES